MPCNKPLLAVISDQETKSGKKKYIPIGRYDHDLAVDYPDGIKIPCGKCAGCRAQKSREWADRMILELDHSKKAVFLTLTYNDDHVPAIMQITTGQFELTLQKRDLQLFMKRLRKRFKDKELRFYAVGEYGKNTQRPHYHLILFGLGLDDFKDLKIKGSNELGQIYYKSDWLAEEVWKLGFCLLSEVSWKTCAYVARYVKKKDMGLVTDEYVERMSQPEFSVMSRDPGIGMYYPLEHKEYLSKSVYYFSDQNDIVQVRFPSVFLNYLEKNDKKRYLELKEERKKYANDYEMAKLYQTDLTSMEMDDIADSKINFTEEVIDFYRGL